MDFQTLSLRYANLPGAPLGLLKAVHAALLAELPRDEVLSFWERHPLTVFRGPLPPDRFLRYLWGGEGKVPIVYFWSVMADLESFLAGRAVPPHRFFRLLNHGPAGGPPLQPGWVLSAFPERRSGADAPDPRAWMLDGLPGLARELFPGCRFDRVPPSDAGETATGSRCSALFLFLPLRGERRMPATDFRLFPGMLLAALPRLLGCSPFDSVEVLADVRGPGEVLGETAGGDWNWKGDALRLGRRRMGTLLPLETLLESWPEAGTLRRNHAEILSCPVARMDRDHVPPGRDRPLLHAGCAYGSPVTAVRIGFSTSRRWKRLAALLARRPRETHEDFPPWTVAESLHRALLDSLENGDAPPRGRIVD